MKCTVMDVQILVPQRTEAGDMVSHGNIMIAMSTAIERALKESGLWEPSFRIVNSGTKNVEPAFRAPDVNDLPNPRIWTNEGKFLRTICPIHIHEK